MGQSIIHDLLEDRDYVLFHEDCLETSRRIPDDSIDLIYMDPPFFSGRSYYTCEYRFDDRWKDLSDYLGWITPRLKEFKRILKETATIYIHCDSHVSHYLKVLADSIFARKNFLNEIVWKRQSSHNDVRQGSRHFGRVHDTILVYAISRKYVWNQQYLHYDESYVKRRYRYVEPRSGRRYALGDLTGPGGAAKGNARYNLLGVERYWRYSHSKMLELLAAGRIECKDGEVPRLRRYLDEMAGIPVQDVWTDIKPVLNSRQSIRFPTQKPEALLDRIIRISSNSGHVIYDPFSGSGTSAAVCFKLSRRWIGSETSKRACLATANRLAALGCKVTLNPRFTQIRIVNQCPD